jgi:hypothetical protein
MTFYRLSLSLSTSKFPHVVFNVLNAGFEKARPGFSRPGLFKVFFFALKLTQAVKLSPALLNLCAFESLRF